MHRSWIVKTFPRDTGTLSSGPALRNFKLKCKWILTLTSSIYSPTIYNLNTQWNWFKHNVWWMEKRVYISHKNPQSSEFKMVDNENSNGFSKTHFRLTRSVKRTLWEFGHGEPVEGQVSVRFYSRGRGEGMPASPGPEQWTVDHTIKLLRALRASGWRMVSQASLAKSLTAQQCKIIQS